MKSRVFKTSVGSLVFFLLVIAGIALIHPVFVELNGFLTKEVSKIVHNFEEKTDLVISYDSLSPSILSGINVRNIKLIDKDTKKDLVNINKATFLNVFILHKLNNEYYSLFAPSGFSASCFLFFTSS